MKGSHPLLLLCMWLLAASALAQPLTQSRAALAFTSSYKKFNILPTLEPGNRLDLMDLYIYGKEASTENALGGITRLERFTPDYIRLRSSEVGEWQIMCLDSLLTPGKRCTLFVRTLLTDNGGSRFALFDDSITHALPVQLVYDEHDFCRNSLPEHTDTTVLYKVTQTMPIRMVCNDSTGQLTLSLNLHSLPLEDQQHLRHLLRDIVLAPVRNQPADQPVRPVRFVNMASDARPGRPHEGMQF